MLTLCLTSTDPKFDEIYLSNFATLNVLDLIRRIPGVGRVSNIGSRYYAMQIWVQPDKLANFGQSQCKAGKIMLYDKDIREPLAFYLEEIYGKNRILEEQVMGQSRADMVMVVHDALYGIEIKSDADSYARLDRQVKDYNLYYDYDLVVVGTRHAAHIKEHVPEWWGIITVEQVGDQVDFYMLREPQSNPQMDWNCKIEILWRPELAHIQELNAMHAYKQKSKRFVADKIVETVPKETLAVQLSEELFERDYTKIWETIQNFRKENGQKLRRRRRRRKTKKQA